MVPCDNEFGLAFSKFLDDAEDVHAFSKLPQPFGFSIDYTDAGMNLRSYYPDFVAVDSEGGHWLIETKGAETTEVAHKDLAARNWCENATRLTKTEWWYIKVPQRAFEVLQPSRLEHLRALEPAAVVKLRGAIARLERSPRLNASFESSVPGLHFIGPASAMSFGPLFRFVVGAEYSVQVLSACLAPRTSQAA